MIQFTRNPACDLCPLHEGVNTVCVPTVPFMVSEAVGVSASQVRALLIVGEAPGRKEDLQGRPFVGPAGIVLRRLYIEFFDLTSKADVYLSNAVRCRPPENADPTATQMDRCRGYLMDDVEALRRHYSEVLILCVGAPAAKTILGVKSLRAAFNQQGAFNVWSTYHPAYVSREPSSGLAVKSHMTLLVDYLDGKKPSGDYFHADDLRIQVAPLPPKGAQRQCS